MTKFAAAALLAVVLTGCSHGNLPTATALRTANAAVKSQPSTPAAVFQKLDANSDGQLSAVELLNAPFGSPVNGWQPGEREAQAANLIALYDANRDGRLNKTEFTRCVEAAQQHPSTPAELFDYVDADRDGYLTYSELLAAPMGQPVGGWKPGQREQQVMQMLRKLDRNGDGRLSRPEFLPQN